MKQLEGLTQEEISHIKSITQEQVNGFYNFEGAYCEHCNFHCKPYSTLQIQRIVDTGLVHVDTISDFNFLDYDESMDTHETVSGVEFLSIKTGFLDGLVSHFGITKGDD